MSNIFAGVYGARFPDVVMNSGPLPPSGGLPAPLHDTPDSRINYNSTLLGDLQPYAYGEPGYQSSQNSYLNIPHRIQKVLPVLYLPEPNGQDVFRLSHSVDDSDLAFVMRLNRGSIFCTGTRMGGRHSSNLGVVADPIINLSTLNYLLAGIQVAMPPERDDQNLFWEMLYSLDPARWSKTRNYRATLSPAVNESGERLDYQLPADNEDPLTLDDIVHFVRNCVRPFGIVRGSEKQGGQSEMTNSPATWPVPTVITLVIDGKEGNVLNIWSGHDIHAGDDLVLRLKLMPLDTYTLNHYYKGFAKKTYGVRGNVWQLVPDVFHMNATPENAQNFNQVLTIPQIINPNAADVFRLIKFGAGYSPVYTAHLSAVQPQRDTPWQEIGYWHIGRSQVMVRKYTEEFYNNDMMNGLKNNHLEITFQPVFDALPMSMQYMDDGSGRTRGIKRGSGRKRETGVVAPMNPLNLEKGNKRMWIELDHHTPLEPRAVRFAPAVDAFPAPTHRIVEPPAPARRDVESAAPARRDVEPPAPARPDVESATDSAPTIDAPPDKPRELGPIPELLPGLSPTHKRHRGGRPKKDAREQVEGMILKPGSEPVPCRVELL